MLGRVLQKGVTLALTARPFRILDSGGHSTAAGVTVSPTSALAASSVYSAASLIAQSIASLPVKFVIRGDESRKPIRPPEARVVWSRPNPLQTWRTLVESSVLSQLLWGNIYLYPRRNNAGEVFELWPIDPNRITAIDVTPDAEGRVGVTFSVIDFEDVRNEPGQPPRLIHIPDLTLPGQVKGLSRIEQHAELIGISLASQAHAARFLGDGVHMSGMIESPKPLRDAQAKELWEGFMRVHAGVSKAGSVGVLSDGATFKPISIPPSELQFLEQMKYSDQKIASLFRVPPHMVGDISSSTSWGTGIEEQTIQFIQHTLLPIMTKIEEAFEAALLSGTDVEMRFVVSGLLRGNLAARSAFYSAMFNIGVFSQDDIRALEDLAPLPDGRGRDHYVPLNFAPIGAGGAELPATAKLLLQLLGEGRHE